MNDFSVDWLALREPEDRAARSLLITRAITDRFSHRSSISALDLASGTGSNTRYLVDHLPHDQQWLLVDRDPRLLAQVFERMASWSGARGFRIEHEDGGWLVADERVSIRLATRRFDLNAISSELFEERDLVTASALLDLVSEPWLDLLATECRRTGAAVLFALSYDGRMQCSPIEDEDSRIRELVNRHQRRDKGFGEALGPSASARLDDHLVRRGYHVAREQSDWVLGPESAELQRQLVDGWARASEEIAPESSATIESWRTRRLQHIDERRSRITVGHQDLAGWLE